MKILIVDDSHSMRKIVKWNLSHAGNHIDKILEASCLTDALHIIETKRPEIVIADWNMPEMGGLQLLKVLREAHNSIQFGFVITHPTNSICNLAKEVGADFIISNPSFFHAHTKQVTQSL